MEEGSIANSPALPLPPNAGHLYPYTDDPRALDSCRAPCFSLPSTHFGAIVTPLEWAKWCYALRDHPDREFVTYIVSGIRVGFRLGFQYRPVDCKAATRNMPSASLCEEKMDEFLATECAAGRILGPFERELVPMVHVSRLGAVPKSTPGKYRFIVDLSHPEDQSVNDGISESRCSCRLSLLRRQPERCWN